jgi:mono/diheme cytochrome c family protein
VAILLVAVAPTPCAADEDELPAAFANRQSPLASDPSAVVRGRALFLDNCASCHGEAADGQGPAAVGLRPPPANLAGPAIVPAHSDAYLFYRLTIGKRGSAMPAFGNSLSETERWEVIAYLRSLSRRSATAPGVCSG